MRSRRLGQALISVVLSVTVLSCSDGGGASSERVGPSSTTGRRASESAPPSTAPGTPEPPATSAPSAERREEAETAVSAVRGVLPYPDDVVACLSKRAALDASVLDAVRGAGGDGEDERALDKVEEAAGACAIAVRGVPQFAVGLQRAAGGGLSDEQIRCAVDGFGALSAEQVAAATAAGANPGAERAGGSTAVEEILRTCDIELPGA